ncbi:hypothetical protein AAFF_G00111310 [Aldrovandia affinis]|uniref:Uncharacterized protein n=1 Tax=Aldrovandia affinis TaxID=143900 RepID=A0AAD7WAN5_9TELE|nr:hypothetical protein AAFF_G00111310 [Aldrovandia affinis]
MGTDKQRSRRSGRERRALPLEDWRTGGAAAKRRSACLIGLPPRPGLSRRAEQRSFITPPPPSPQPPPFPPPHPLVLLELHAPCVRRGELTFSFGESHSSTFAARIDERAIYAQRERRSGARTPAAQARVAVKRGRPMRLGALNARDVHDARNVRDLERRARNRYADHHLKGSSSQKPSATQAAAVLRNGPVSRGTLLPAQTALRRLAAPSLTSRGPKTEGAMSYQPPYSPSLFKRRDRSCDRPASVGPSATEMGADGHSVAIPNN